MHAATDAISTTARNIYNHIDCNHSRSHNRNCNFIGNLYNSLNPRGIQTFIDDEYLMKGEEITPALLNAIQESRIFIAVFSVNYASSTHCLNELVMILECLRIPGRLFLPVFYDVDPSQVRHQTGTYAEALAKHKKRLRDHEKDKVQKWRVALSEAANVSGGIFNKGGLESEYKFLGKIVEVVSAKINRIPLHVAENPVGLEPVVLEVASLLGFESESDKGVNMVGIYGIAGIGKSTIARAVHNLIVDQFEGVCFLANVRKRDLAELQETLLSEILGEKDIRVGDIYRGISIIKKRLHRKKVLLILDNADKGKQLKALAGGNKWFGPGSKIIITTRNKNLLVTHGIVKLYEIKHLNDEKALELFSWHALKSKKIIDPCYLDIANRAVSSAIGLPLALEVIGSHLFGKSLDVWKSALDKYEKILHKDIQEILEVSYDDLEEEEKGIFHDMSCFFNSYEMGYVKQIQETKAIAREKTAMYEAAREVIKELTTMYEAEKEVIKELTTMLKKLPNGSDSNVSQNEIQRNFSQNEIERTEQYEPGVYVSLTCLSEGARDIVRVQFSRNRFSEIQAERWWAENHAGVYERYKVRRFDKSIIGTGSENLAR